MSVAEQVQKAKGRSSDEDDIQALPEAQNTPEIDDLIDEIDSVLEENAEQFVNDYRQAGGQ